MSLRELLLTGPLSKVTVEDKNVSSRSVIAAGKMSCDPSTGDPGV